MNRALFGLNVVLVVVLTFLVQRNAREALELRTFVHGNDEVLPAAGIRLLDCSDRWRQRWVVDFGADMATGDDAEVPEGAVKLSPEVPLALRWRTPSALELTPMRKLERAKRFDVLLGPELEALDGRRIPDLSLFLETARPRLLDVVVAADSGLASPTLLVTFDLPVEAGALQEALSIRAGTQMVPTEVSSVHSVGEHALALRLWPEGRTLEGGRARAVVVEVDGSLESAIGGLSLGRSLTREVLLEEELRLRSVEPDEHGIDLIFNRGIPLPGDGHHVRLLPSVPFQVVRRSSGIRLVGEFPAGAGVRVVLPVGFPGRGPALLSREETRAVRVADLRPSLEIAGQGSVLSSRARPEILVRGVNVTRLRVRARTVYPNNLVRLAQSRRLPDALFGEIKETEVVIAAERNARFHERIDLAKLLGTEARGIHEVIVEDIDRGAWRQRRLIQITDLGISVRAADDAVAVQVRSLATGKAVADAAIRVLTPSNQELVSGMTGGNGIALLRYPKPGADWTPFIVQVTAGRDLAYVDLEHFRVELAGAGFGGRSPNVGGLEAWVQGDRGVVRPGGTLRAVAIVRDAGGDAPSGHALRVRWRGPDTRVRATREVDVPESGLLVLDHPTDSAAATGPWRVELIDLAAEDRVIGQTTLRVEAFVPARLEAEVLPVDDFVVGGTGAVEIRGRWLEGTPAQGLVARVFVRFDEGRFEPDGFAGFSFRGTGKAVPPGGRPVQTAVLDASGSARVRFSIPDSTGRTQTLAAQISVELQDPSGRVVRAGVVRPVHRRDHHIGVRAFASRGQVVVVDANGKPVESANPVLVELVHRRWTYATESRNGVRWRWTWRVDTNVLRTWRVDLEAGRGEVRWARSAPQDGWLAVRVRDGDRECEQTVGAAPQRPDRLRVSGPKRPVAPGRPFEIDVDSPVDGRAFVTIESTTVHAARTASLSRGRTRIVLEMPADLSGPNVHVVVTQAMPQARAGAIGPWWLVGGMSVGVDRSDRELSVTLQAPDRVRPRGVLEVAVEVKGATEAVVGIVDEGILQLTAHGDPDPFAWFTAHRRLETRGADSGTRLLESFRFDPGALVGGGGGDGLLGPRLRGSTSSLIETFVRFKRVPLGADGQGLVSFPMPAFYEGRVRVAVVAAGARGLGASSRRVIVADRVGLRAAGPRMLAPRDVSLMTLTLRNGTEATEPMRLQIAPFGGLETVGDVPDETTIAPGAVRHLDVAVRAGATPGVQGLKVTVSVGGARRERVLKVLVRPPAVWSREYLGVVASGKTKVSVPGVWGAGAQARLRVFESPEAQLLPTLQSLLVYPYGCVEQTTSRCRALLACQRLLPQLSDEGSSIQEAGPFLRVGVDRLLAMQTHAGGLAWWPGGRQEYPFGTVWALDFLLAAKAAGVFVPEVPLRRLVDRTMVLMQRAEDLGLRVWMAETLSRAGRPVGAWLARLHEFVTVPEDRARLALALYRSGQESTARELLKGVEAGDVKRESAGLLRSTVRAFAIELQARLVVTPTDRRVPELVGTLLDAMRRPGRLTTQESGHVLVTLADWFATRKGEGGVSDGILRVGTKTYPLAAGKGVTFDVAGGESLMVGCTGSLFGVLEISGPRIDDGIATASGLEVTRRIVDVDSGKIASTFRRGGVYRIEIRGSASQAIENVLVSDVVPGGFEIEPVRDFTTGLQDAALVQPNRIEARDDRVLLFTGARLQGRFVLAYRVRAVFPGEYRQPPLTLEALYEPGRRVRVGGGGTVEVTQ